VQESFGVNGYLVKANTKNNGTATDAYVLMPMSRTRTREWARSTLRGSEQTTIKLRDGYWRLCCPWLTRSVNIEGVWADHEKPTRQLPPTSTHFSNILVELFTVHGTEDSSVLLTRMCFPWCLRLCCLGLTRGGVSRRGLVRGSEQTTKKWGWRRLGRL